MDSVKPRDNTPLIVAGLIALVVVGAAAFLGLSATESHATAVAAEPDCREVPHTNCVACTWVGHSHIACGYERRP